MLHSFEGSNHACFITSLALHHVLRSCYSCGGSYATCLPLQSSVKLLASRTTSAKSCSNAHD